SVSRETECSRVGKQSFIVITLGCSSVLIQFAAPKIYSFCNILKTCRGHSLGRSVFCERAPTEPLTHWYQVWRLLQSPVFAKAGDTLLGTCLLIAHRKQSYNISIVAQVDQAGSKSSHLLGLKNPDTQARHPHPSLGPTTPTWRARGTWAAPKPQQWYGCSWDADCLDLSNVITGGSSVGHSTLIPLGSSGTQGNSGGAPAPTTQSTVSSPWASLPSPWPHPCPSQPTP
ncbi:Histone-arginine methyltransferase CARM1, partial [Myotis davidii]